MGEELAGILLAWGFCADGLISLVAVKIFTTE